MFLAVMLVQMPITLSICASFLCVCCCYSRHCSLLILFRFHRMIIFAPISCQLT